MEYCFSRQPFLPDPHMVAVQIQFTNSAATEAKSLRLEEAKLQSGMRVKEFPEIGQFRGARAVVPGSATRRCCPWGAACRGLWFTGSLFSCLFK